MKKNNLSWYSKDILSDNNFTIILSNEEETLLSNTMLSLNNGSKIKTSLKKLQAVYDKIMHSITYEFGFVIVKGFPTVNAEMSLEKIKNLFIEFCKNFGSPLIQNRNQDIIFDVKSIDGMTLGTKDFRGPYLKESLPMHTDAGAILGMYCLSASGIGGETLLCSARTVHDEIKRIRPDLLTTLFDPFYVDRRGQEPIGSLPYDLSPVFAMYDDDQLVCQYHQPFYADVHKKNPEIPKLTTKQIEALDLFDKISMREDIIFKVKLEAGSVIFINNENILHGRNSFEDTDSKIPRHLLRIWLNTDKIKHTFPNFLGYPD